MSLPKGICLAAALLMACGGNSQNELDDAYRRLDTIASRVLQEGATPQDNHELRKIRDIFSTHGDLGATFVIEKLRNLNAEEAKFVSGPNDFRGGVEYATTLIQRGKNPAIKFYLCHILADSFPNLSLDTQGQAIKVIAESYTPSTFADVQYLNHALLRIGVPAIPELVNLANHENDNVRCRATEELNNLTRELAATNEVVSLDCHASAEEKRVVLSQWRKWWDENGKQSSYQRPPSFFDILQERHESGPSQ